MAPQLASLDNDIKEGMQNREQSPQVTKSHDWWFTSSAHIGHVMRGFNY